MKKEKDLGKKNSRSEPRRLRSIVWCILFAGSSPEAAVIDGDHGGTDGRQSPQLERDESLSLLKIRNKKNKKRKE